MIIISIGRWSYKAGKKFIRKRIYRKGHWTPFVKIYRRYADPETTYVEFKGVMLGTPESIHEALVKFKEALHLWEAFMLVNPDIKKRWKEFKNVSRKS